MQIYFYIGLAALFVLQFFTVPYFLKCEIPKACKKSLLMKMVCATIFILTAVISMISCKNYSVSAIMMLIGLVFSWFGDFLLHVSPKPKFFILGLFSFLIAHLCYISSYTISKRILFPDSDFLGIPEVIAYVFLIAIALTMLNRRKIDYGDAFFPCILYLSTIGIMAIQAISLAIRVIIAKSVGTGSYIAAALLIVGSLCFVISDYTLAILSFCKGVNKHGGLRKINIYTYFFGQMLLALTTLFFIV